ncbi:MAG: SapC family protein [Pseudohongiella sp.]|uniref:SapC family protein n=1 Tax=Pseudohongiella sp. TaxID=1979412 RepID=UPI0034A02FFC
MISWIPLSRTDHADKHWRPRKGYEFAATQQVVSIILAELAKVMPHYATGFVEADDGAFQFVALVGMGGERNLYVTGDSQWLCSYVPASLRAYPFAVLNDPKGNKIFCLDEDYISDDDMHPRLFQEDGELEKTAADTLDFISHCERNRLLTLKATSALVDADLLEPWPISISSGEGQESLTINGMYRVNEKKMNSQSPERMAALRDVGALPLAYAQIFSMSQLEQLTHRADHLAKEKLNNTPTSGMDNLFSNEDSGSLNFDAFESSNDDTDSK